METAVRSDRESLTWRSWQTWPTSAKSATIARVFGSSRRLEVQP